jgi:hypothetical protein
MTQNENELPLPCSVNNIDNAPGRTIPEQIKAKAKEIAAKIALRVVDDVTGKTLELSDDVQLFTNASYENDVIVLITYEVCAWYTYNDELTMTRRFWVGQLRPATGEVIMPSNY